jgi:cytochrome c oxidase subunit 2
MNIRRRWRNVSFSAHTREGMFMMTKYLRLPCSLCFILLFTSACTTSAANSALDPHGPSAARLAELWWLMLIFGTIVFIVVVVLLFAALLRGRRGTSTTVPASGGNDVGRNWLAWGGIVMPLIVIGIIFAYSVRTLGLIETPPGQIGLQIQVIGRRWWWEVEYPDQGITTANEIHIPVGLPVRIQLESADIIHSFWVPELHGKLDAIPSRINYITLQADRTGIYRGQCAEFCGLQHAHMGFLVIAQSNKDFNDWLNAQQKPAGIPTDQAALAGQRVFLSAGCVFCHTVRGLDDKRIDRSAVDLGPDLTHVSSRLTIAGTRLTETMDDLQNWIVDPQHFKQGSLMPKIPLQQQDLQALLAYLETLH